MIRSAHVKGKILYVEFFKYDIQRYALCRSDDELSVLPVGGTAKPPSPPATADPEYCSTAACCEALTPADCCEALTPAGQRDIKAVEFTGKPIMTLSITLVCNGTGLIRPLGVECPHNPSTTNPSVVALRPILPDCGMRELKWPAE
ncbi:unnamed protein product [Calypogeia fissa]